MSAAPPTASVTNSARRLVSSVIALGRIRLELLAIEAQEEKERFSQLVFWGVLSALTVGFGLVFVALFGTVLLWESHRLWPLGIATLVFVVLAIYGLSRVRQLVGQGSTLFKTSLAELRADEAVLRQQGDVR